MPRYQLVLRQPDGSEVTADYDSGPGPVLVGDTFTEDGVDWRVVAEEPIEHDVFLSRLVAERVG